MANAEHQVVAHLRPVLTGPISCRPTAIVGRFLSADSRGFKILNMFDRDNRPTIIKSAVKRSSGYRPLVTFENFQSIPFIDWYKAFDILQPWQNRAGRCLHLFRGLSRTYQLYFRLYNNE